MEKILLPKFFINKDKNRIEIYFAQKPNVEMLNKLRQNKWIWSPLNKCWYLQKNNLNYNFAKNICHSEEIKYKEEKISEFKKYLDIPLSTTKKLMSLEVEKFDIAIRRAEKLSELKRYIDIPLYITEKLIFLNVEKFVIVIKRFYEYYQKLGNHLFRDMEKIIFLSPLQYVVWLKNKIKEKENEKAKAEKEKELIPVIDLCSTYGIKLSKYDAKKLVSILDINGIKNRLETIKYYNNKYPKVNMGKNCLMMTNEYFHDYLHYLKNVGVL